MADRPTHLDESGRARMVDVSEKPETMREAIAGGRVRMSRDAFAAAREGGGPKGDIRAVAEIAGVMAGKRTSDLIPLCHPLALSSLKVEVAPREEDASFVVTARAKTTGPTGVEMEALTAVAVACLTIYDMLKAIDREMIIEDVKLLAKSGGASGDFTRGAP
ncbi:MAG TPA: cyclic pyranopterin monophosphate synthase MoaC [Vitreimonas sp.]|uniref:cyclic pyranopterin monophosphate synthase MoaC n=1 Tax=Vitreimonas sp. TaxID=3069702 RepID=UPI002D735926|nr:cyclic pyranopterin monophosphate synthase MoaC [Vitreimonas sp.]HYD89294.1 cyclic pyranopterin monophosphate synthase MoaC [Vitreimonas sp.]